VTTEIYKELEFSEENEKCKKMKEGPIN